MKIIRFENITGYSKQTLLKLIDLIKMSLIKTLNRTATYFRREIENDVNDLSAYLLSDSVG